MRKPEQDLKYIFISVRMVRDQSSIARNHRQKLRLPQLAFLSLPLSQNSKFPTMMLNFSCFMWLLCWTYSENVKKSFNDMWVNDRRAAFVKIRGATHTAWCSEIGSLTSLYACNSGVSSDRREPISLHQAVCTVTTTKALCMELTNWLCVDLLKQNRAIAIQ